MPTREVLADVQISSADVEAELDPVELETEPVFRLLILGDFCGQSANRGRRPTRVDRDNVEDVLASFAPEVKLPTISLRFSELDHFHPDHIYSTAKLFQEMVDMRTHSARRGNLAAPPRPQSPPVPPDVSSGNLLDEILEESESSGAAGKARKSDEWTDFLHDLVAPYAETQADPGQREWEALVDAGITEQMRGVLHDPAFQSLESLWRSIYFLLRRLDTDSAVHLYIADLPKKAMNVTSLKAFLGSQPQWDAIIGNYTFTDSDDDVSRLLAAGSAARSCGARFVAAADPQILGFASFASMPDLEDWQPTAAAGWRTLRAAPEAHSITLALPRILLRLPYGTNGESTERFAFEEVATPPGHDDLLWASGAFACALVLAGESRQIEDLPVYAYDGEMIPCAEAWMTERAIEAVLAQGLTPLISVKGHDRVVVPNVRTLG